MAVLAYLVTGFCMAVTLAAGIGTVASGTDKTLAVRAQAVESAADDRNTLADLRRELAALAATNRPSGTIEAELAAARVVQGDFKFPGILAVGVVHGSYGLFFARSLAVNSSAVGKANRSFSGVH